MTPEVDDPRLTAFALGELPETDRPEIERALAERPDLAREVDQIRRTAQWLTDQLHAEQARETVAAPALPFVTEAPRARWYWRRYSWMSGVAALAILGFSTALLMPAMKSARESTLIVASRAPEVDSSAPYFGATAPPLARSKAPADAVAARSIGPRSTSGVAGSDKRPAVPGQMSPGGMMGMMGGAPSQQGQAQAGEAGGVMMDGLAIQPAGNQPGGTAGMMGRRPPVAATTAPAPPRAVFDAKRDGSEGIVTQFQSVEKAEALGYLALTDQTDRGRANYAKELLKPENQAPAAVPALAAKPAAAGEREAEARAVVAQALAETDMDAATLQPESRAKRKDVEAEAAPEPVALQTPEPAAEENPFVLTSQETTSTFAIDVDTASYSIVRRSLLEQNRVPSPGEVRIEEMLNYFPYQDAPPPADGPDPFAIHVEAARCPWNAANRLARIGVMGRPIGEAARKPSNLVFLIDVSGSMDQPNKLPLAQWGMQKLVEQLGENDRVAIVVYAGSSGLVLPSTSAMNKPAILSKIEELRAGGSTNGGAGIQLAYDQATEGFLQNGINRVILATDGDFNVGVTDRDELVRLIESKAKGDKPIFLTVLGFGMDNLKDGTLEKLADKGNGHYAYIDGPAEARKVLVEEMGATLDVIAKDVKIQVEFNSEQVREYRLIGYENRVMPNQDFRDDAKDGGEIGAGHHVTALYEYVPVEPPAAPAAGGGPSPSWFKVRLRYKPPQGDVSTEIERPVVDRGVDYADASDDFKLASAVAGFGMILRRSPSVGSLTLPGVIELASPTLTHDPSGYRREFLGLVRKARDIQTPALAAPVEP